MRTERRNTDAQHHVAWHPCMVDGREHAITDEEFARAFHARTGTFEAVCGHVVSPGSMLLAPGRDCPCCLTFLRIRSTMRSFEERVSHPFHRTRRGWLRRFVSRHQSPAAPPMPEPLAPAGEGEE